MSRDVLAVFDDEASVRRLSPDQAKLFALGEGFGVIVSAKGDAVDFVSRFFAPKAGVAEDPVTGSAHCALAAYWGEQLSKSEMVGYQASKRGGVVRVALKDDRVLLRGTWLNTLR